MEPELIQEAHQRLADIQAMQQHFDSGQDVQMGQLTMEHTTPEERRVMLAENIRAHWQVYEDLWEALAKDLGSERAAEVRAEVERGQILQPLPAIADSPDSGDVADCMRLHAMYSRLSEEERQYIVDRWDEEQDLEPARKRLDYRARAPERKRHRRLLAIVALVPLFFALRWWFGLQDEYARGERLAFVLDYLEEHVKEVPGLQAAISQAEREYENYLESQRLDDQ